LIAGAKCLDLGQSTGGFTQVLLQHGASLVVGVEVGHGQLHSSLRQDPRVNCIEGLHLKDVLQNADFIKAFPDGGFDLVVADLSFISLRPYLPLIASLGKKFILLIKPQFEVGPENLTKDFMPKKNYSWLSLQRDFCDKFKDAGLILQDWFPSRIEGKEGNQEFLTILDSTPGSAHRP
jgi:23S rRNA (cytidine1920-2'-O)/16S rRNA (cytidine1409-2'-O)-methyltransferase